MKTLSLKQIFIATSIIAIGTTLFVIIIVPLKVKNPTMMDGFLMGLIAGAFFAFSIVTGVFLYVNPVKKESN